MNREDIIRMAREAGLMGNPLAYADWYPEALERFAALVAAATAKEYEERLRFTQERWEIECKSQVEIEREACAKVCEAWSEWSGSGLQTVAKAIRTRGQE